MAVGLFFGMSIKVFNPFNTNLTICPLFLQVVLPWLGLGIFNKMGITEGDLL